MQTPASILIVDDEIQNRRLLEVLLGPEGYVTRTAGGGKEALASIAEAPPDLILLDFLMPGIDGRQVASAVKANPATRNIPIIMLTALDHREALLAALDAGVEEFVTKPVDRAELWLRVRNLLRLKELSDLLEQHQRTLEAQVQARTADLRARTVELQVSNDAIRTFAAVATHDLRTPLASIVGFSALLSGGWNTLSEENRRKFVASIDRQSHNLSILVDDLLASASIDDGGMSMSPELIVLKEAIDQCLELGARDTAGVAVSCSAGLMVRVDPHHLGRMLGNYVQNAFSYGEPPVRIDATQVGDMVKVRVLDSGPGVPPEFVSSLFGRFARADTPATRAQKGTGLGLSIVRGLAEANGGQTRYEPNIPNGSCFVLELPAGHGSGA
jgi:signal transduction histidine kinase